MWKVGQQNQEWGVACKHSNSCSQDLMVVVDSISNADILGMFASVYSEQTV